MKFRRMLFLLFVGSIILCGCGNGLKQEVALESYQIIPQQEHYIDKNDEYRSIQITYPQIEVYGNAEATQRLNAILASLCAAYGPATLYCDTCYKREFTYEITYADEDIFSICLAGNTYYFHQDVESLSYGVTFDVQEGMTIHLEDTEIDEEDIQNLLDNGQFTIPKVEKKFISDIDFDAYASSYLIPLMFVGFTEDGLIYSFGSYDGGRNPILSYEVPYVLDQSVKTNIQENVKNRKKEMEKYIL
ncbi:MAG: hypothetical protein Q4G60_09220 [bacterium]|nr:hypothetical protein [bacterium]